MGQKIFIGTEENMGKAPPEWMWFKPVAAGVEIYALDGGSWVLKATLSVVNVKCGSVSIDDGDTLPVTFTTAFSSTPKVVATFGDNQGGVDIIEIDSISTTGFTLYIEKGHGGQNHTHVVNWIATDAGDP